MRRGFTLIELLIVVAIIAILAAIAVPNFLEAQVRSKVSRAKADIRTAATALESYSVDHNCYPYDGYRTAGNWAPRFNYWYLPSTLSSPISYITSVQLVDPFRQVVPTTPTDWQFNNVRYTNIDATWGLKFSDLTGRGTTPSIYHNAMLTEFGGWRMTCVGPDRTFGPNGWPGVSTTLPVNPYPATALPEPYDATNGTISPGDIIRSQVSSSGYVNAR